MRQSWIDLSLLAFGVLASAYFGFLVLDCCVLKLDMIWLGVVWELLTIPLVLVVAAAFVVSISRILQSKRRPVGASKVSAMLVPLALNCFVWESFAL